MLRKGYKLMIKRSEYDVKGNISGSEILLHKFSYLMECIVLLSWLKVQLILSAVGK
jgi:hypothetical protein